jgi:hypothetical protein
MRLTGQIPLQVSSLLKNCQLADEGASGATIAERRRAPLDIRRQ